MSSLHRDTSETQAKYLTVLADDSSPGENNVHEPVYDEPIDCRTNDKSANMDEKYPDEGVEKTYVEPNPIFTHAREAQAVYTKREREIDNSEFPGIIEKRREKNRNGIKATTKKRLILVAFVFVVIFVAIVTAVITYLAVESKNTEEKMVQINEVEDRRVSREYVVMFTKNFKDSLSQVLVAVKETELELLVNGKTEKKTINFVAGYRKTLDDNMVTNDNIIQSKGVLLKTTNDVSVYGMSTYKDGAEHCCSSDGFAAIPVKHWGQNYKAVTLMGGFYKKQIGVVSIYDNTNITFKLNTPGEHESTINISLNRLQTYQLSPFGLYSGDECGYYNESGCSYMVETIPKITDWGNVYIIPPFKNVTSLFVKIVPSSSDAVLSFFNGSTSRVYKSNGYLQVDLQTELPILVHGDSKFLLAAYGSYDKQFYFMTLVPSICQYSNDFIVMTSSLKTFHNYVSVIIRDHFANGLIFDKKTSVLFIKKRQK